jgi:hypothetical protein
VEFTTVSETIDYEGFLIISSECPLTFRRMREGRGPGTILIGFTDGTCDVYEVAGTCTWINGSLEAYLRRKLLYLTKEEVVNRIGSLWKPLETSGPS